MKKENFPKDQNGKFILKDAKEISQWVKLGFEEQKAKYEKDRNFGWPFELTIDLSGCSLSTSYSQKEDGQETRIFNLYDLADVVDGIKKIDKDGYLFEIEENINLSNSLLYGAFFHRVIFKKNAYFDESIINSSARFIRCIFWSYARFNGIEISGNLSLETVLFKDRVSFEHAKFKGHYIDFLNVKFESNFCAKGITFLSKNINDASYFKFILCDFLDSSDFSNITFPQQLSFDRCIFQDKVSFVNNQFINDLTLQNCKIVSAMLFTIEEYDDKKEKALSHNQIESVVIWSSIIDGEIHFEKCQIKKIDLAFSKINSNGRIRFYSTEIDDMNIVETTVGGRIDMTTDCVISKLNMEDTIVSGYINTLNAKIVEIKDRYTARILKNEAIKANDTISALKYKQIEMEKYRKSLQKSFKWNIVERHSIGEIILLYLNKLSNYYGANWIRGVAFTMLTASLFYFLINWRGLEGGERIFIFNWHFSGFEDVWKSYLQILNVLNFKDKLPGFRLNAWGETFFFVSKIFISYGIYQIVSAFRKYGK